MKTWVQDWSLKFARAFFLFLIFSLAFMQPGIAFLGYPVVPTDLIFLACSAVTAVCLIIGAIKPIFSRSYFVFAAYFAAMLLSVIFSEDPRVSWQKLLGATYLIGLAVLTINFVPRVVSLKRVLMFWLAGTAAAAAISVVTLVVFYLDRTSPLLGYTLFHFGTLPPGNYPRVQSTFLNANMLCNYLNVGVMFLFAAHRIGWVKRSLFYPMIVSVCVAVMLSLSPGIGGVILSVALWTWYFTDRESKALRWSIFAAGVASAAAFFAAMLPAPGPNPLSEFKWQVSNGLTIYGSERISAWIAAAQTLWEYPIFGRGLGLSSGVVSSILPSGQRHTAMEAHQMWLNFAAQTGIVGLGALSLLIVYVLRKCRDAIVINVPNTVAVAATFAFIGAFLFQGLGGSFEDARHLWVLIGLCCALPDREPQPS